MACLYILLCPFRRYFSFILNQKYQSHSGILECEWKCCLLLEHFVNGLKNNVISKIVGPKSSIAGKEQKSGLPCIRDQCQLDRSGSCTWSQTSAFSSQTILSVGNYNKVSEILKYYKSNHFDMQLCDKTNILS